MIISHLSRSKGVVGGGGGPQPTFVNVSSNMNTDFNGFDLDVPSGTINGDLMIAGIVVYSSVVPVTPSGWNYEGVVDSNNSTYMHIYTRIASSEPTSYTWTIFESYTIGGKVSVRGCNTSVLNLTYASREEDGNDVFISGANAGVANRLMVNFIASYDNACANGATEGDWVRQAQEDGGWFGVYLNTNHTGTGSLADVDTGNNETNSYMSRTLALEPA